MPVSSTALPRRRGGAADLILQIRLVMRTLENPLGLFFLTGVVTTKRFSDLPFERRETALINMLTSRIAPLRGVGRGMMMRPSQYRLLRSFCLPCSWSRNLKLLVGAPSLSLFTHVRHPAWR